jgi:hypothetical protein
MEVEKLGRAFELCIDERYDSVSGKVARYNVVRVQAHGIVRFACWWFVIWSVVDLILSFALHQ